jgi:uncharacterized protein (DUF1800 family)
MAALTLQLLTAFNRFGFGPKPGDFARTSDPRAAIRAELATPQVAAIDYPNLDRTAVILQAVYADQELKKSRREHAVADKLARAAMPAPTVAALIMPPAAPAPMSPMGAPTPGAMANPDIPPEQKYFRAEALARIVKAVASPIGYSERLVAFWSNHFAVSVAKSNIGRAAAGSFEREAIRPYIAGRFADMARAVEQHPVMLNFLDNAQSIGPNSKAGRSRKAGLNENLAREILELHTLGVGAGYTQNDVTELAKIITGWTIAGREGKLGEPGTFAFNANAHEPGPASLLGHVYAQDGVAQGEAALDDIVRREAVAIHIARKLTRHFVADDPDPALVSRLAKVFRDTDGDLGAVSRALVTDEASWSAPMTKLRNPWEIVVAGVRAFNQPVNDAGPFLNMMNLMGMPLWQPGGPNGFSDDSATWASPEGMKMRLELASQFAARQTKDAPAPAEMIDDILGPTVSQQTRETVMRAESREQAYALLLMSPEFQRR